MGLALTLLGSPRAKLGGTWRNLNAAKPACLLYYLAARGDWVARPELTLLFWPERDEASARHALRQLVYRARALPWAEGLEVEETRLRWLVPNDLQALRSALAASDWPAAVRAYRGTFLEGIALPDAPGFDAWCELEREHSRERYLEAAVKSAAAAELQADYPAAVETLRSALEVDPLAEPVAVALMRSLALAGEPDAARSVYARFERDLAEHLGGEPGGAARTLVERLRRGERLESRPHNLPRQATDFVGREQELLAIGRRLRERDGRLISLLGPGGIGKTRLALQAAADQIGAYRNGVYLVTPEDASHVDGLVSAIADVLGMPLRERGDPWSQLAAALAEREVLLVLDGLEALPDAGPRLAELLARAPGLTVLATSRAPLGVSLESRFVLDGLQLPSLDAPLDLGADSVRLFVQTARRMRPSFSLRDGHGAATAEVCRLVAGVPLAIELAAAWIQVLSPQEIAAEIERDLDILRALEHDRPARQRSLRRVFEATWERLDEAERAVLLGAAGCAGPVDLAALTQVAGASLDTLSALTARGLVRRDAGGRVEMHQLVRQYARERLAAAPEKAAVIAVRHLEHYADRVANWTYEHDPTTLVVGLRVDLDEIRAAWRHAVASAAWTPLEAMAPKLSLAHDLSARAGRYLRWLEEALARLDGEPDQRRLRGRLQAQRAGCLQRLGRYEAMEAAVQTSLALLDGLPPVPERCIALRVRGNAAYLRGDHDRAEASFEAALEVARALDDERLIAGCYNNLGLLAKARGALDLALERLEAARSVAATSDLGICSQVLNNLATVHARSGDARRAESLLLESAEIKRRLGDERGLASNYTNLGNLRAQLGDRAAAERYHQESMELAERSGDRSGVARAHTNLANLALLHDDVEVALGHYRRSLDLKRVLDEQSGVLEAFVQIAACHRRRGEASLVRAVAREARRYADQADDPCAARRLIEAGIPFDDEASTGISGVRTQVAHDGREREAGVG